MSRPLRIEYDGAFYHVMNRGLNRSNIFLDPDQDRNLFKRTLAEAVDRWKIRIHAYSLMDNHYHLLVETPLANLSRAMRHVDGVYTQRFNRRHCRDGPLLRGRFKSILVEKESYFLELVRYIHLNGVKAKVFPSPQEDIHCSHWDYLHPRQAAPWLEQSLVLSYYHYQHYTAAPHEGLHQFVVKGIPEELERILARKRWPAVLGAKPFVHFVRENYLKSQQKNRELPQKNRLLQMKALPANRILRLILEAYDSVNPATEAEQKQLLRERRWAKIYFLGRYGLKSYKDIGALLGESSYKAVQMFFLRNNYAGSAIISSLEERLAREMLYVAT